ncbi:DUF2127 domain-containing protein [Rhodoferax aquaticus]|uniref:DUF2127 domain-containing protein n=1 Tax=Rhodoferax aquaticus TaxID=2527691 RepID=A0A515EJN6_9BURK|nr:DUF2127 domain-containing protein [Rhodoferax aquaticus]QDL52809.1 DUF2127 domain-containing protein [Rhodoferax aquaticus]
MINKALLSIALFEGLKGLVAIAASVGLLGLAHHDVQELAYALLGRLHVDPQAHFPRMLLDDIRALQNADMRQVILLAWGYAALRPTEGYGLWRGRVWAEWLAAVSGAVYVPLELSHLVVHTTAVNLSVLSVNVGVVAYLVVRLRRRRRAQVE